MKARIILIVFLTFNSVLIYSQQFQPLGPGFDNIVRKIYADSTTNLVYACGYFQHFGNGAPGDCIAAWNGLTWDTTLSNNLSGFPWDVNKYNGNIIVGGSCHFSGINGLGIWNGSNYQVYPIYPQTGVIKGTYTDQSNLVVFGDFDSIGNISCQAVARYNGTNWNSYPSFPISYGINTGIFYQSELYIGGGFFDVSNGIYCLAKYNGTTWTQVGNWPISGASMGVYTMLEWNNKLYIGGYFNTAMGTAGNGIVCWDGSNFSGLDLGFNGNVWAIQNFKNELYIGGSIQAIANPTINYIAKWDGFQWLSIGTFDNSVTCFAVLNNKLYIGGGFTAVNGITMNRITVYDPTLGLSETDKEYTEMKVSPNPFIDVINIATTGAQTQKAIITDIGGRTVFEKEFTHTSGLENNYFELCLEDLPNGLYSVTIISKDKTETKKIVKQ